MVASGAYYRVLRRRRSCKHGMRDTPRTTDNMSHRQLSIAACAAQEARLGGGDVPTPSAIRPEMMAHGKAGSRGLEGRGWGSTQQLDCDCRASPRPDRKQRRATRPGQDGPVRGGVGGAHSNRNVCDCFWSVHAQRRPTGTNGARQGRVNGAGGAAHSNHTLRVCSRTQCHRTTQNAIGTKTMGHSRPRSRVVERTATRPSVHARRPALRLGSEVPEREITNAV